MLKKNIKPVLLAGALALATAVSPVLAEGEVEPTPDQTEEVVNSSKPISVTKRLNYAEGISTINETYTYTVTPKTYYTYVVETTDQTGKTITVPGDEQNYGTNTEKYFPTVTTTNNKQLNVVVTNTTPVISNNNNFQAGATDTITFTATENTIPGIYTYEVTETESLKNEVNGISKLDDKTWTVFVQVTENNGIVITEIKANDGTGKADGIVFTNEYTENTAGLTVTKNVSGLGGDKTEKFDFTIKLTLPYNNTGKTVEKVTGNVGNSSYEFTFDSNGVATVNSIKLAHGDKIVFTNLPAGTAYEITETAADQNGYETAVTGADSVITVNQNTDVASGIVNDNAIEAISYTNTKGATPITGVIVNNMPYIALLGASGAGLVVLAASKKRSK